MRNRKKVTPYLFLLPFLTVSVVFSLIPIIYSLRISFLDFTFLDAKRSTFVGVENYMSLLNDEVFIRSILNTFKFILVVIPPLIIISLGLALTLNTRLKGRSFFRSAFYMPYIIAPVAVGVILVQLLSKDSFLVTWLAGFGFEQVSWHTREPYAFYLVSTAIVWTQMGFYMVLYLNGLQNIPKELMEAAKVDGANKFGQFKYIILPMLKHTTFLVVFMSCLNTLQVFDQPYVISTTGMALPGSPGDSTLTMIMYIYTKAFRYVKMGEASAAAFIVFVFIFVISVIQNSIFKRKEGNH